MRKRTIKKIGGSLFLSLSKSDVKDFGLREGAKVDIDDLNLLEKSDITEEEKEEAIKLGAKK